MNDVVSLQSPWSRVNFRSDLIDNYTTKSLLRFRKPLSNPLQNNRRKRAKPFFPREKIKKGIIMHSFLLYHNLHLAMVAPHHFRNSQRLISQALEFTRRHEDALHDSVDPREPPLGSGRCHEVGVNRLGYAG